MNRLITISLLFVALCVGFSQVTAQKKPGKKADKAQTQEKQSKKSTEQKASKETTSKEKNAEGKSAGDDPVVGKTKDGKSVYAGSRGGFYYLTEAGNKTYVKDFVGQKIVGKTADGLPIYEGPRGGRFYYNAKGDKIYVQKDK